MTSIFRGASLAALAFAIFAAPAMATETSVSTRDDEISAAQKVNAGRPAPQRAAPPRQPVRVQQRQPVRVQQSHQRQPIQRVQPQRQNQRVQQNQRQQQQRVQQHQQRQQQTQSRRDRDDHIRTQQRQRQEQQQRAQRERDQKRQDQLKAQQNRQDQQKAQQQHRQDQIKTQQQQRQDQLKAQQQPRDRLQRDRQRTDQNRHQSEAQRQQRDIHRKQQSDRRQRDRQFTQRERQIKKDVVRTHRDIAKADRLTQRNNRRQVDRITDMRRAKDRADLRTRNRIGRDVARSGRFAGTNFANRNFARVRFAGWSPQRAWRRGLLAAFIPWAGAVYMPYIYNDMFDYTFWPTGYHSGYWAYAYDDFFDGIWWAGEPTYVTEAQTFRPASSGPALSGAGSAGSTGVRPQDPDDREDRVQPQGQGGRVTAATTGEGACGETGRGLTAWPFDRIQSSLDLSDDQQDLLDELRDAAVQAADALRDSCPQTQPRNAVDRLQAMLDRLEGTLEAVKYIRPAMEAFYNSLDDDQRERFQELGPKLSDSDEPRAGRARPGSDNACGKAKPGLANFPIERIQETVSLQDDQLDLLDALEDATFKALDIMKAACPDEPPVTPSERLKATQSRIEAMLQAAKVIQPALDDFYSALNDQQKTQFNSMKG